MDFLDIRKKARERASQPRAPDAGAGAAGATVAPEVQPAAAAPPPPAEPAPAPATRAIAEALQDLPAPPTPAVEPAGPRFTAWRPGEGPPPAPTPRAGAEPPAAASAFTTWRPGDGAPPLPLEEPPRTPARAAAADPAPEPAPAPGTDARVEQLRRRARGAPARDAAREVEPAAAARRPSSLDDFFYRPDEDAPELALGVLPGVEDPPERPRRMQEFLTFRLGAEEYAVAIDHVREVLRAPPITEVPRAPAAVLGVVTVRGEVVAIFDPRRRLGLPGSPPGDGQGRIVLVDLGEGRCGLLVDAVSSVVRLPEGAVEPCPQGIGGAAAECLAGIGRDRDRLFTVLDLAAVLRRPGGGRGEGRADAAP